MDADSRKLTFDDALDALGHIQRRTVLVDLLEHNPQDASPVPTEDSERDVDVTDESLNREHVHLPKLEEYGLIEWQQGASEVVKGPKFDKIQPLLELLNEHQDELPDGWL